VSKELLAMQIASIHNLAFYLLVDEGGSSANSSGQLFFLGSGRMVFSPRKEIVIRVSYKRQTGFVIFEIRTYRLAFYHFRIPFYFKSQIS